jgi:3-hydroxyacyl-[acyl-carrier-protein] dehydratase
MTSDELAGFDQLVRVEVGREAVAIRNVPGTLSLFDSHFPRFPVLPGVVLLHGIAQLAAVALGGPAGVWTLSGAEVIRFRHFIRPGDQALITVTVQSQDGAGATCAASVDVEGRTVATARRIRLVRVPTPRPEGVHR